ncbi:unnamed protein product, partial [Polarella glacialis]
VNALAFSLFSSKVDTQFRVNVFFPSSEEGRQTLLAAVANSSHTVEGYAESAGELVDDCYSLVEKKLFALPNVVLLSGMLVHQPLLVMAVLPVSIALDFARSKVMTKLSSHIEKASLQIQKLVARRKKVEQHDVNHEEVISRSGTSHITAYQWNSLAKQVFEKRSWQKALASFRMYLNWLYYQDILGVGIECALARMMELGRISSADIGVYASVIEDSIDLLLTRYREESRLAQMETHRDKLLELSEALDNVRSRLRGGAGSRIQSLCKVDSSSRFLELRDFEYRRGDTLQVRIPELRLSVGKVYAVTGANGCGKSTLFGVLASCGARAPAMPDGLEVSASA